ncbi:hypothetical protein EXU48_01785 [Occultella glacieicola]|uniref:Spore coat protein U domain-containing protein n=1 Tax=Occultella glacieicola TaxID=2518684 RepID=A0ABY2E8W1_9MICO|nr:hypothetical protein [Occultella glacieicola]TDE98951.1 hypothetical protein EXU48_01785 [Occultella glacieicola]
MITCHLSVNDPHNSSHVGGTINVAVKVNCTAAVPSISIRAQLRDLTNGRSATSVWTSGWNTNYHANTAALICKAGTYQGAGYASVIFPVGFNPSTGLMEGAGRTRALLCNGATVAPMAGSGVEVILEATYDPALDVPGGQPQEVIVPLG